MKKLIVITMVGFSLVTLYNCSPKTTKSVATTDKNVDKTTNAASSTPGTVTPPSSTVPPTSTPLPPSNSASTAGSTNNVFDMPVDQQLNNMRSLNEQRVSMGKTLYEQKCKSCHELHAPNSRVAEMWLKVMIKMAPNAKLTDSERMMVSGYLVQNAKK